MAASICRPGQAVFAIISLWPSRTNASNVLGWRRRFFDRIGHREAALRIEAGAGLHGSAEMFERVRIVARARRRGATRRHNLFVAHVLGQNAPKVAISFSEMTVPITG